MDPAEFPAFLRHYFSEELKQSWIFMALGLTAILAGSWLWRTQSAFRHALWPLLLLAAIQLAMGGAGLLRIPGSMQDMETRMASQPAEFKASEILRLARILDAFRFTKLAEIALLLTAMALALLGPHSAAARGWALGLLLQSSFLLAANLVAEQRTETYLDLLRRI